jgi:TolA-binding protein
MRRGSVIILALALAGLDAGAQAVDTAHAARHDSTLPTPIDTGRAVGAQSATPDTTHPAVTAAPPRDTSETGNPATDTALARVRSLVAQGQTGPARALVDSLLASTPTTSPTYASILYTRATLATNADSAEDDYRRVIVEYAASPRVADALLRLAQLELARGDREQAAAHLDRLTREQLPSQTGPTFARTELQVGLAYFDLQDTTKACAALGAARTAAPTGDVELSNRIDYNTQRCPPPAPPPGVASARDTTHNAAGAGHTAAKCANVRVYGADRSVSDERGGRCPRQALEGPRLRRPDLRGVASISGARRALRRRSSGRFCRTVPQPQRHHRLCDTRGVGALAAGLRAAAHVQIAPETITATGMIRTAFASEVLSEIWPMSQGDGTSPKR